MNKLGTFLYFLMIASLIVVTRLDSIIAAIHPQTVSIQPTTIPSDSTQVLKDLRTFYADCWTMLLTYVTILIGFVGLVLPWIMKRDFSSEIKALRASITDEFAKDQLQHTAQIAETLKTATDGLAKKLRDENKRLGDTLGQEIDRARAHAAHLNMSLHIQDQNFLHAVKTGLAAASLYLACTHDDVNLRSVLTALKRCTPHVPREQIDAIDTTDFTYAQLIADLRKANVGLRYEDCLVALKSAYENAGTQLANEHNGPPRP